MFALEGENSASLAVIYTLTNLQIHECPSNAAPFALRITARTRRESLELEKRNLKFFGY